MESNYYGPVSNFHLRSAHSRHPKTRSTDFPRIMKKIMKMTTLSAIKPDVSDLVSDVEYKGEVGMSDDLFWGDALGEGWSEDAPIFFRATFGGLVYL